MTDTRDPSVAQANDVDSDRILADYIQRFSRWGMWGPDDEIGALNYIGPEQVTAAASLVRDGRSISLTLPYDKLGCQPGSFRPNPQLLVTASGTDHLCGAQDVLPGDWGPAKGFGFADDMLLMPNQSGTQWDALSHIFFKGKMWNGRSAAASSSSGAAECSIDKVTNRIVGRGVLADVAALKGVAVLAPGYPVTPDDLDAALERGGVAPEPGDVLIVHTGFLEARRGDWGDYAGGAAPGLSLHTAPWLYEHEIAAIVTDTWGVEVRPNEISYFQPLHIVALVYMGVHFGEIFDLTGLAADCAADGRYEFLFVAPPLPITGAAGSPVSALALK